MSNIDPNDTEFTQEKVDQAARFRDDRDATEYLEKAKAAGFTPNESN